MAVVMMKQTREQTDQYGRLINACSGMRDYLGDGEKRLLALSAEVRACLELGMEVNEQTLVDQKIPERIAILAVRIAEKKLIEGFASELLVQGKRVIESWAMVPVSAQRRFLEGVVVERDDELVTVPVREVKSNEIKYLADPVSGRVLEPSERVSRRAAAKAPTTDQPLSKYCGGDHLTAEQAKDLEGYCQRHGLRPGQAILAAMIDRKLIAKTKDE